MSFLIALGAVACLILNSCAPSNCDKLLARAESPDGNFSAEVVSAGNCIASINTIVSDVKITDNRPWLWRRSRVPFSVKGATNVQLDWSGSKHLMVRYYFPGEVPERILRREEKWGEISITYDAKAWNGTHSGHKYGSGEAGRIYTNTAGK